MFSNEWIRYIIPLTINYHGGVVMSNSIALKFLYRIRKIQDPLAQIITLHLFTENWLDKLIKNKAKNPQEIQRWNYRNKLSFVYNMDLIPDPLYHNLIKLNSIRNKCAHDLNYDLNEISLFDFSLDSLHDNILKGVKKGLFDDDLTMGETIDVVGFVTFGYLHNHCTQNLKMYHEAEMDN